MDLKDAQYLAARAFAAAPHASPADQHAAIDAGALAGARLAADRAGDQIHAKSTGYSQPGAIITEGTARAADTHSTGPVSALSSRFSLLRPVRVLASPPPCSPTPYRSRAIRCCWSTPRTRPGPGSIARPGPTAHTHPARIPRSGSVSPGEDKHYSPAPKHTSPFSHRGCCPRPDSGDRANDRST
jgi:hypothetical protein